MTPKYIVICIIPEAHPVPYYKIAAKGHRSEEFDYIMVSDEYFITVGSKYDGKGSERKNHFNTPAEARAAIKEIER